MDLAVRLAANDLINAEKKRAIIFISDGDITQNSFDKYSLNEMTSYLNNNFISFLMIQVEQKAIDDSLDYLVKIQMELNILCLDQKVYQKLSKILLKFQAVYTLFLTHLH